MGRYTACSSESRRPRAVAPLGAASFSAMRPRAWLGLGLGLGLANPNPNPNPYPNQRALSPLTSAMHAAYVRAHGGVVSCAPTWYRPPPKYTWPGRGLGLGRVLGLGLG